MNKYENQARGTPAAINITPDKANRIRFPVLRLSRQTEVVWQARRCYPRQIFNVGQAGGQAGRDGPPESNQTISEVPAWLKRNKPLPTSPKRGKEQSKGWLWLARGTPVECLKKDPGPRNFGTGQRPKTKDESWQLAISSWQKLCAHCDHSASSAVKEKSDDLRSVSVKEKNSVMLCAYFVSSVVKKEKTILNAKETQGSQRVELLNKGNPHGLHSLRLTAGGKAILRAWRRERRAWSGEQ